MKLTESQKVAICRVLLDVSEEMQGKVLLKDARHYAQLCEKAYITEDDFMQARGVSVLSSLVVLKEMPYNLKMLLGLTVCGLYSEDITIPVEHRMACETLMSAIDWPISFSEISSLM